MLNWPSTSRAESGQVFERRALRVEYFAFTIAAKEVTPSRTLLHITPLGFSPRSRAPR